VYLRLPDKEAREAAKLAKSMAGVKELAQAFADSGGSGACACVCLRGSMCAWVYDTPRVSGEPIHAPLEARARVAACDSAPNSSGRPLTLDCVDR
jgi:hypothetical protein